MAKALIHHIYDSSFVDGPGNRMAVFFQGCNMNCWYCHNPETIGTCLNCGTCLEVCKSNALKFEDGKVVWDSSKCVECLLCEGNCKNQASPRVTAFSVEDLLVRIRKNRPFITGITCSGGECTLQKDFLIKLFRTVKEENGINFSCLLDSNGSVLNFEQEKDLLSVVDGVMLDVKEMDPLKHESLTGQKNDLVIQNAIYLAKIKKLTEVRTVVTVKDLNAQNTIENVAKVIVPYIEDQEVLYRLIPFRNQGVRACYQDLGSPSEDQMAQLAKIARENGFQNIKYT